MGHTRVDYNIYGCDVNPMSNFRQINVIFDKLWDFI